MTENQDPRPSSSTVDLLSFVAILIGLLPTISGQAFALQVVGAAFVLAAVVYLCCWSPWTSTWPPAAKATALLISLLVLAFVVQGPIRVQYAREFGGGASEYASIECRISPLPGTVPANGVFYTLSLFPTPAEMGGGGLEMRTGEPGSKLVWPKPQGYGLATYRCDLTNYVERPLLGARMSFEFRFRQALPVPDQPNSLSQGAVTLARDWPVNLPKVDTGAERPFVFYMMNLSNDFVVVSLPRVAFYRQAGLEGELSVPIVTVSTGTLLFPPGPT